MIASRIGCIVVKIRLVNFMINSENFCEEYQFLN
jgi:hypothetical protein